MRRLQPDDLIEVNRWYVQRGLKAIPYEMVPKLAFIEPGVAAAFVYRLDIPLLLVDGYITNPRAGLTERHQAIELISLAILELAKAASCKLLALSKADSTERLAMRHGFTRIGEYTMLAGA